VNELRKLFSTPRGKAFAAGWGLVIVAAVGFAAIYLAPGSGTGAIKPLPVVRHKHPTPVKAGLPGHPEIAETIPPALAAKLIDSEVVLVEIYNPGTALEPVIDDREAYTEALAGAKAAGIGFAAVDVTNEAEMQLVSSIVKVSSDPYLFIIDRSGDLLFQRGGYLDRDTVAQASSNALIGAEAADPQPIGPKDGIAGPYNKYWQAEADSIICEGRDRLSELPKGAATIRAAQTLLAAQIGLTDATVAALHAVPAIGPQKAPFEALIGDFATVAADQRAALALIEHTPPKYEALKRVNKKIIADAKLRDAHAKSVGITCFEPPLKPGS
jgi:hypothetical protein